MAEEAFRMTKEDKFFQNYKLKELVQINFTCEEDLV